MDIIFTFLFFKVMKLLLICLYVILTLVGIISAMDSILNIHKHIWREYWARDQPKTFQSF